MKKIHNPIGLTDHVLIILPKLTIFDFWKKKEKKSKNLLFKNQKR